LLIIERFELAVQTVVKGALVPSLPIFWLMTLGLLAPWGGENLSSSYYFCSNQFMDRQTENAYLATGSTTHVFAKYGAFRQANQATNRS